jgi:hypothetical protein
MCETFHCETNVLQGNQSYNIKYFLVTEDELHYGIKSTVYENRQLQSTNLVDLAFTREDAENLICLFCINYVFPSSYADILADMSIPFAAGGGM